MFRKRKIICEKSSRKWEGETKKERDREKMSERKTFFPPVDRFFTTQTKYERLFLLFSFSLPFMIFPTIAREC